MTQTRRYFLKSSGLTLFGVGVVPSFMRRAAFALDNSSRGRRKVLVGVFQRGAVDGLNVVIPFSEKQYYAARPTIAIPEPSSKNAADGAAGIDLDGFFALHPSLAPLKPIFDSKQLAIVHAVGSPSSTRSHFDAQDYMETATPDVKSTTDGWLNRYLQAQQELGASPFRAVGISPRVPQTLRGSAPSFVVADLKQFKLMGNPDPPRLIAGDPAADAQALQAMYASAADPLLNSAAQETFNAIAELERIQVENYQPANGAVYPNGPLGRSLRQVAQLIKEDVGLEVAFTDVGGWDHHVNEGGIEGQLANHLTDFGNALAAFHQDLGDRMEDVVLLTMSEFGRTVRENGNRGTDHGHANAMFVMGGTVKGGKVYVEWPGLRPDQLYQNRDLALTTDFRNVFAEAVVRHLGTQNTGQIFPGFEVNPSNFRGFLG